MSAAFSDLGVGPNKHYSVLWKLYTFSESHPRYLGHSIYFMLNYLQVEKLAWRFKVTVMLARLLCDCLTKPRALTSKNIIHMYKLLKDQPMQFGYFFGGGCNFIAKWNRFWPLMWPYCRVGQVSATHVAILQSGTGFGHSCGHIAKWDSFRPLMWSYCKVGQVSATHVAIFRTAATTEHKRV